MKTFLRAFLLLCAFAAHALAGDYANMNFIGFSKDGKYLAFEEWGEGDPGGWYSKIYYVETVRNSFAVVPSSILDDEGTTSLDSVRKKNSLASIKNLRKLKIIPGNTGQMVVAHLLTDWTYDDSFVRRNGGEEKVKFNGYINPNSPNQYEFYEITLKSILTAAAPCKDRGFETYKLELSILDNTHQEKNTQILQEDAALPVICDCPYGYKIESVYMYGDKIAVFLNVFSQGFEGPNMRYMVVAGELEYTPNNYDYFNK